MLARNINAFEFIKWIIKNRTFPDMVNIMITLLLRVISSYRDISIIYFRDRSVISNCGQRVNSESNQELVSYAQTNESVGGLEEHSLDL